MEKREVHWEILAGAGLIAFSIIFICTQLFNKIDNRYYQIMEHHYEQMEFLRNNLKK